MPPSPSVPVIRYRPMKSRTRPQFIPRRRGAPMGSDLDFLIRRGRSAESLGKTCRKSRSDPRTPAGASGVGSTRSVSQSPEVVGRPSAIGSKNQRNSYGQSGSTLACRRGVTVPSKTASALPIICAAALGLALIAVATSVVSTAGVDVVTYHNDVARTGQNLNETLADAGARDSAGGIRQAGSLRDRRQGGRAAAVSVGRSDSGVGVRNVLYVATEHDSVYAFDADTGAMLWRVIAARRGRDRRATQRSCGQVVPEIGITSTPVIDRSRGPNGVIYVVAHVEERLDAYFQRLHALDVTTGARAVRRPARPFRRPFPGTGAGSSGGVVTFDPKQYEERSALLLVNGRLITAWTSHCDIDPYTGWIMAYDPATLAQTACSTSRPTGRVAPSGWPARVRRRIRSGNIYLLDGNGTFDTTLDGSGFPTTKNFGNAFLKVSTAGGLAVADYFATFDTGRPVQRGHRSGLWRHAGLAGFHRQRRPRAAPRRRRRQGRAHLRRRSRRDGQVERLVEPELPGHQRRAERQRVLDAGVLQQHAVLRRVGRSAQGLPDRQRTCRDHGLVQIRARHSPIRDDAGHLRVGHVERDRLGGGELEPRGAARLRRHESGARAVQLEPGRRRPRQLRRRATSSSRRRSSTAACMSARRPASPCSETSCPRRQPTSTSSASGLSSLNEDQIAERGARLARRDDRAYREYVREEQRRQPGCPARVTGIRTSAR